MILIVGLGNPGAKYEKTRHNLGFKAVDLLADRWSFGHYDSRFNGEVGNGLMFGQRIMLLKPQTFMNLSGASVAAVVGFQKLKPKDVWVIHDDLDLPLGRMRIRVGGSSGGHNGVASVIERLGSPEFTRFRLGIGRPSPSTPVPVEDYVVQPFGPDERQPARDIVVKAADAVEAALKEGLTHAMNVYNS
jgi:PTH1 family peptidyl-tRNA hydrolase